MLLTGVFWQRGSLLRWAWLYAALLLGGCSVIYIEILGACTALGVLPVFTGWMTATVLAAGWFICGIGCRSARRFHVACGPFEWGLLAGLGFILLISALVAFVTPPNVWDGLTYHMSRVTHWIQQQSLRFYPTPILRQLHMPPGAEFFILQLQLLSGGDCWAPMVQVYAMCGCALLVTLPIRQWGGGIRMQLLAVVLVVTLPAGLLQAASVQNDWVVSLWLLAFAVMLLRLLKRLALCNAVGAGTALGLALLTKGTALFFAAPLGLWLVGNGFCRYRRRFLLPLLGVLITAVVLNGPWWLRNVRLYGSPLGPGAEGDEGQFSYAAENVMPAAWVSGLARNLALHACQPWADARRAMEGAVRMLHHAADMDINDPATTWTGTGFHLSGQWFHEVHAGNPLHLLLLLVVSVLYIIFRRRIPREVPMLLAAAWAGFLLFCGLLKWQPWGARLHLPLFVLGAPPAAVVLTCILPRWIVRGVVILLLSATLPFLVFNELRPLVGARSVFRVPRFEQRFYAQPAWRPAFRELRAWSANGCTSAAGLLLGPDDPEYLFHVAAPDVTRWINAGVRNISSNCVSVQAGQPEMILTMHGNIINQHRDEVVQVLGPMHPDFCIYLLNRTPMHWKLLF
jgi:hypothetical protein